MVDNRMIGNDSTGQPSTRTPGGHPSSRMEQAREAVTDVTRRVRERAGDAAHAAGDRATHAIDKQKGRVASRLSRIATSMRDASHCFSDNDEAGLGQYVEAAADRLEEVGDYLDERPVGELRHEASMFLRRHPEIGLAGAFLGGILIARFLRASATPELNDDADFAYGDGADWGDENDFGSSSGYSAGSFAPAAGARAPYRPGRGVIVPSGDASSSGPSAPGHAMARNSGDDRGVSGTRGAQSTPTKSDSPGGASTSRNSGGESCVL